MRKILLSFLLISFYGHAQVNTIVGIVYDQETGTTLPFVNITVNKSKWGTAADIDGKFDISSSNKIDYLTFSFVGYERFSMPISSNTPQPLEIYMRPLQTELLEVELIAGENPAHRIINKAIENRTKNNPEELSSFEYISYNKFLLTLKTDSDIVPFDTTVNVIDGKDEIEIDSTNFFIKKFMDKQHLFLMESVSERKFKSNPHRNNERVIASRTSGFKNPTFALLATQFQSFSFYNDFISVLDQDYLNPISKGSTRKYNFLIEDTTINETDTTYIISFSPDENPNFDALKGVLYITSDGWALQNVLASPFSTDGLSVEIQQKSKKYGNQWFPVQMNYDFLFTTIEFNGIKPIGIGRTYINNVKIEPEISKKDFSRIEIKIEDNAHKKTDPEWNKYRVNPLDKRERATYHVIDSLGKAEKFETKLKWAEALSTGRIRWSFVDIELDKLLNYNIYEGLRLGAGARTNEKISERFTVGGYFGYGFKDRRFKYGYDIDLLVSKEQNIRIGGGYFFDIEETGGQKFAITRREGIFSQSNYREFYIQQFDEVSSAFISVRWDILPNLQTKVFANRQNRFTTEFGYKYLEDREDGLYWVNGFTASQIGFSLFYAPNDKYLEGPFGRRPIQRKYPTFELQYTKGLPDILDGNYEFDKIDLRINHSIKTRVFGVTHLQLAGGYVLGDVPYPFLYSSRTNRPFDVDFSLLIADQNSFETMFNNEFISDRFVHFMFRQNFQSRILHFGKWKPDLEYVFRAAIGDLKNPEKHGGLEFNVLNKGYFETGLELNKIYQGLGLGVYYRIGEYQLPNDSDNLMVKLSFRTSFF